MATRELQCPCGITLKGADDDELFRLGRRHADQLHRSDNITDEFIRDHVRSNARDVQVVQRIPLPRNRRPWSSGPNARERAERATHG